MLRTLAILLLFSLRLACQPPAEFAAAGAQIQRVVESGAVPGIAVAVTRHGRLVWEQGFGWADRERRIPATAETPFYLASVTKSLTSTALMTLHQSGKLELDRPVNDYLGAAKLHSPMWDARQATVRGVASHTAGLTTFYRACDIGNLHCKISLGKEIQRYGIVFWPPGERFDYSNLDYAVLGEAIARVARQSFATVLKNNVFVPLVMGHCDLDRAHGAAANYDERSQKRTPRQISGTPGASAGYCSAHDLAQFAMFQLKDHVQSQHQILSDAAIDELHRPLTHLVGQQYAMGWWTEDRGGENVIFGQGGTTNSFAVLELFPAQDLSIVILANSWSDTLNMPNAIEQAILAELLPKLHAQPQPQSVAPAQAPLPPPAQQLPGKWVGRIQTYRGSVPMEISMSSANSAQGRVGTGADMAMRELSIGGEHVYGILSADLRDPDAPPPPYDVEFDLLLRGSKLVGAATTRPGKGSDAQLPHWTQLQKTRP